MAKRDARKETQSKGKSKAARHSAESQARKDRRVAAQGRLAARPDDKVSANCLKSRQKRRRAKAYAKMSAKDRNSIMSPSEAGERQYGDTCTDAHKRNRRAWRFPTL